MNIRVMNFIKLHFVVLFVAIGANCYAQEVLLQSWYWDYPKTAAGKNWTDTLDSKLADLANKGFSHIWLPPFSRASFGNNSNGYDPKDLYDLGAYNLGPTGFGTRAQVDSLIAHIKAHNMKAVADVVYNHRDGGKAEDNPSVEGWIENYNCTKVNSGDNPYPSDRFRCYLPLGGSSGNGAGTYYIKVGSASGHSNFFNRNFKFYAQTNTVGYQNLPALTESEPNGGGSCGGNNIVTLGRDMISWLDNLGNSCNSGSCSNCSLGCGFEEFQLTIAANQYNAAGDTLWIYLNNIGAYSDHYVKELYANFKSGNFQNEIRYQTYTNFMNMPSGRGTMNHTNFKPNGNPTNLNGDWDSMLFFYDYDQSVADTRQELIDWTQWLCDSVKIEGLRMDAVKHFDPVFLSKMFDSLYLTNQTPDLIVGEFFDTNPGVLKSWSDNVKNGMTITAAKNVTNVRVFDFALRGSLKEACDNTSYNVSNLFSSGIVNGAGGNKNQSVTFINNHDYRDPGQPVNSNPELAYAYILANPSIGIPTVFYPDYYGTDLPNGPDPFLKADIDVLMHIRKNHIANATVTNYITSGITYTSGSANRAIAFESKNGGLNNANTVTVINFGNTNLIAEIPITFSGIALFEKTGKTFTPMPRIVNGKIKVAVPPRSYGIWSSVEVESTCAFNNKIFVDANATGKNNGSSWTDAFANLESAIVLSNGCPNIDSIFIKQGTYKPSFFNDSLGGYLFTKGNVALLGGFPSATVNPSLVDRDPLLFPTIISGDIGIQNNASDNIYNVIRNTSNQTTTLDGITITNGNAKGSAPDGAGVYNTGQLKLKAVTIQNCTSIGNGSAIFNGIGATLLLEKLTTQNNISNLGTDVYNKGIVEALDSNSIKD